MSSMGVKCKPECTCKRHKGYWSGKKQDPKVVAQRAAAIRAKGGSKVEKICEGCGEPMLVWPYQAEKRRYHNRDCMVAKTPMITAPCKGCGKTISYYPSQSEGYCSRDCAYEARSKGFYIDQSGYRILTGQYSHPLAGANGALGEHRKVLYDKIGPGTHSCNWCDKSLEWGSADGICADHLDWDKTNNDPANLVPSCHRCNWKRTETA